MEKVRARAMVRDSGHKSHRASGWSYRIKFSASYPLALRFVTARLNFDMPSFPACITGERPVQSQHRAMPQQAPAHLLLQRQRAECSPRQAVLFFEKPRFRGSQSYAAAAAVRLLHVIRVLIRPCPMEMVSILRTYAQFLEVCIRFY